MKLERHNDICKDKIIWSFSYNSLELVLIRLNKWDKLLIKECERSDSIADKLLALECIARKIEKANEKI